MPKAPADDCYTCSLLPMRVEGEHTHTFEDLAAAELAERVKRPHRAKALWAMVDHARSLAIKST